MSSDGATDDTARPLVDAEEAELSEDADDGEDTEVTDPGTDLACVGARFCRELPLPIFPARTAAAVVVVV
jgi:hypothetical protein